MLAWTLLLREGWDRGLSFAVLLGNVRLPCLSPPIQVDSQAESLSPEYSADPLCQHEYQIIPEGPASLFTQEKFLLPRDGVAELYPNWEGDK